MTGAPDTPKTLACAAMRLPDRQAMNPTLDEIIANFELLEDWDDRYRYLIELGKGLTPLPEEAHNDANKVRGCASQVWLVSSQRRPGRAGAA